MSKRVLSVRKFKKFLPQRYPMLMLDRVELINETKARAIKNLTMNELYFQGHFPGHPIMPGVLKIEAMKQLAELLTVQTLDPTGSADVYARLIEKVKFRKPNYPGDRLLIEAEVVDLENDEAVVNAKVSDSTGLTCEATITLALRSKSRPRSMPAEFNKYDLCENTAMDINDILARVPHRYPFLLIDNVAEITDEKIVAVKNVSINEEIFANCDDNYAVLPESIQCEIMAQVGCASVLSRPENEGKLGYFMSIDKAEAFAPIYAGDQLICEVEMPPARGRFGKGTGEIRVKDEVVFRITLMFAIVDADA